jgi:hypothetical protein
MITRRWRETHFHHDKCSALSWCSRLMDVGAPTEAPGPSGPQEWPPFPLTDAWEGATLKARGGTRTLGTKPKDAVRIYVHEWDVPKATTKRGWSCMYCKTYKALGDNVERMQKHLLACEKVRGRMGGQLVRRSFWMACDVLADA